MAEAQEDLRISLIDLQLKEDHQAALADVEFALEEQPELAKKLGLSYLRGHLLLRLDRRQEALQAFATTLAHTPPLEPFSRFRLAVEQEKDGHPEVAAGLVATLLGSSPPKSLRQPAMALLARTIAAGGDCRLLRTLERVRWTRVERRILDLARSDCTERQGDPMAAAQQRYQLLEAKRDDGIALKASERLSIQGADRKRTARQHLLLGLTYYNHREFERAIYHLARTLVQLPTATNITSREAFECRYALARSHFWQGRYNEAARAYSALAQQGLTNTRKAQVRYQQARSLELNGQWPEAINVFRRALAADPRGRWSDAALIASMRLQWLSGLEAEALADYQKLLSLRHHNTASRAALFLASSDLVQGRVDRAQGWLDTVDRLGKVSVLERAFWRGRLEEIRGRSDQAVAFYARALTVNPYHPIAEATRQRLEQKSLQPARQRRIRDLRGSQDLDDLYDAWLLQSKPQRRGTRQSLENYFRTDPATSPFVALGHKTIESWPLWKSSFSRPEELLLALGLFDEGNSMVLRHFPAANPALAFAGSFMLSRSGAHRRSLYIAEILAKRIPSRLPPQFLPAEYRQLLFPFGYSFFILRETRTRDVDPFLLAGVIREESRFDPGAFSGAAARGLTQFVLPTAKRIAQKIGFGPLDPEDLANPETSIRLGAAYLEELLELFDQKTHHAVAAYNAGETQSQLWARYCLSDDPAEFLTKVTFTETRNYLAKVLTSRAHYQELYGSPEPDGPSTP